MQFVYNLLQLHIQYSHTYQYTCYKTVKVKFYLSKNLEFTDIASIENINIIQNDRNFETLYLPKCLHYISYIPILFKNHKIFLNSNLKMHFYVIEVL